MDISKIIDERFCHQLDFLIEVDKMKTIFRQSIVLDESRHENDAEHSWHIALMAITFYEYCYSKDVDLGRVVKMLLVHDLVEIYAGDTFAYDTNGYGDKEQRETDAADKLFGMLPQEQGADYYALWVEFDKMETPDAVYAAAIDRIQPFIGNFKTNGYTWREHSTNSWQVYKRMEVVKTAMPDLWLFVESVINDAIEKGNLIK